MNWFECKVSYERVTENGVHGKVTESYLVDALSHAEAESRIIEELQPYISGEFIVSSVRRVNYSEILPFENSDYWWKVEVSCIVLDGRSGVEKRTNVKILAQGDTIEDATERVREAMKGSLIDHEITGVKKSNLFDIFIYGKNQSISIKN